MIENKPSSTTNPSARPDRPSSLRRTMLPTVGGAAAGVALYVLMYFQTGAWQMLGVAGVTAAAIVMAFVANRDVKLGRIERAQWWLLATGMVAFLGAAVLWVGVTAYLFIGGALVLVLASQLLKPSLPWSKVLAAVVVFVVLMVGIELLQPLPRYAISQLPGVVVFLNALTFLAVGVMLWFLGRSFRLGTIRTRLLVAFAATVVVPVIASGAISSAIGAQNSRARQFDQLDAIATFKDTQLSQWLESLRQDLHVEIVRDLSVGNIRTLLNLEPGTQAYLEAQGRLRERFSGTVDLRRNFEELMLIDGAGNILVSTDTRHEGINTASEAFFQRATRQLLVTPPQIINSLGEYGVMAGNPVVDIEGRTIGVVAGRAADAQLNRILSERAGLGETGDTYLVGSDYRLLNQPSLGGAGTLMQTEAVVQAIQTKSNGTGVYLNYNDVPVTGAYHWITDLQAVLVVEQTQTETGRANAITLTVTGLVTILIMLAAIVAAVLITRSIANPIGRLANAAQQVAAGDLSTTAPIERNDEIGTLAQSFNSMTEQLRGLIGSLEDRVAARTEQLLASADVGRAAATNLNPDVLLNEVANLITNRFGFYYAAIFVIDDTGQFAVLRAATGEAGRVLKERGHKLAVGGQSMVGYVTTHKTARIALDVGAEAVRLANPLLPETRSEIALPLIVGKQVLGALDVQSTAAAAFDEASAAVLQSMADQIAVALNNAILFAEASAAEQRARALYAAGREIGNVGGGLSHNLSAMMSSVSQALYYPRWWIARLNDSRTQLETLAATGEPWPNTLPVAGLNDNPIVRGATHGETHTINDPASDPQLAAVPPERRFLLKTLSVPIAEQGRPVGVLVLGRAPSDLDFITDDREVALALSGLAAIAIQNNRLFEQTRQALAELDVINRRLTGEAWTKVSAQHGAETLWVGATEGQHHTDLPEVGEALRTGELATHPIAGDGQLGVAVPIKLRDAAIGALRLAVPQAAWNDELRVTLEALAGHVAQAAENARLIEETERSAQRERTINEINSRVRQTIDLDTILRTAVNELGQSLKAARVTARIGATETATGERGDQHA